jgi:hypothetical protein
MLGINSSQEIPLHKEKTMDNATPMQAVPVDSAKAATPPAQQKEQDKKDFADVDAKTAGKDYFTQQEEFAKKFEERAGEDSFRRAARIERENQAAASEGDPTRDPVAKQQAMDKTVVQPGAVADAQKIKDIGKEKLDQQSTAFKGVK